MVWQTLCANNFNLFNYYDNNCGWNVYLWHNKNDTPYLTQEYINFTHIKHKFALSAGKKQNTKSKQKAKNEKTILNKDKKQYTKLFNRQIM